jgi:DNA polymerase theta
VEINCITIFFFVQYTCCVPILGLIHNHCTALHCTVSLFSSALSLLCSTLLCSALLCLQVLSPLQQARRRLILQSGFHVIFLVTPPSTHIRPNWDSFESLLDGVLTDHPGILPVVELLGASRGDLCHYKHSPPTFNCNKPKSLFYKRFYSALLLFNLIQEIPLNKISQWVDIQRGQLQQLQKEASTFCGMIVSFCEKLNWVSLKCVLATYTSRLMFGVKPELLPLTRLGTEVCMWYCAR